LILFDSSVPGEFEKTEEFGGRILEACVEAGGCITGEHGVGLEKIRQMAAQFNDDEIQQFHSLKTAFDAKGLLNPGKGIPTLKRCQEYRAIKSGMNVETCSHDHGHEHHAASSTISKAVGAK